MFTLCRIVGGSPTFVSLQDCPSGFSTQVGSKIVDDAAVAILRDADPMRAILLASNLGLHNIGFGHIMFSGSPLSRLRKLDNGLIIDGDDSLPLRPFIFNSSLTYVKTLLDGTVVYKHSGPPVAFCAKKFYFISSCDSFIDKSNQLLNDSISRTLTSDIISSDAPAVAKSALVNVDSEFIFAPVEVITLSKYSEANIREQRKCGIFKDPSRFQSLVSSAYQNISQLGLVLCGNSRKDNIGYDINYFTEVNGHKYFRPTDYGIDYPSPRFRISIDSAEADESVVKVTRLAIINARKEIIELNKAALALQDKVELAASNYSTAKNNLEFGSAKIKVIMKQIRAILETPIVFPYNNQVVGLVGEFIKLNPESALYEDSGFSPTSRFRSNWVKQRSCGNDYFGLRACWASSYEDSVSGYYNGEEYGMAPNYLANMGITISNKEFVLSRRQTYKPWFGSEKTVVQEKKVVRPCYAGRVLMVSLCSYLNQLSESIRATLKLNIASETIISESLASYSALVSERESYMQRVATLEELIKEYGDMISVNDYPELSIDERSEECPLIVVEDLVKTMRNMGLNLGSLLTPANEYLPGAIYGKVVDGKFCAIEPVFSETEADAGGEGPEVTISFPDGTMELHLPSEDEFLDVNTKYGVVRLQRFFDDGELYYIIIGFDQSNEIELPPEFSLQSIFATSESQASILRFVYGITTNGIYTPVSFQDVVASSESVQIKYGDSAACAALALIRKEAL